MKADRREDVPHLVEPSVGPVNFRVLSEVRITQPGGAGSGT